MHVFQHKAKFVIEIILAFGRWVKTFDSPPLVKYCVSGGKDESLIPFT
jgi:hypothetical protein